MKKSLLLLGLLVAIAFISACKTHERCAAYGKYGNVQIKNQNLRA